MPKPVPSHVLDKDEYVLNQLETIAGYKPADARYTAANLRSAATDLTAAGRKVDQLVTDLAAARDAFATQSHTFHDLIEEAKTQVKAQFGSDSDQVHAIGLVKKSERKKPVGRNKAAAK